MNPNPLISWFFWRRINAAIHLCGDEIRGKRVLDFGCGLGVTFLWLVNQQCKIVGCDIEYAQAARKTAGMLNGHISVVSDLDKVVGPFDYILAMDVLEHVTNLEDIVARFRGLSASGARLIVSGPTETPLYKLGRFIARYESHSHKRNIDDIEQVLSSQGLELIKAERLFPIAPLFRVTMWKFK
jgi:2-polyprenyl-3-methyl-5-hydroxy-6-metoxy-1,4-benzoquinol methylase